MGILRRFHFPIVFGSFLALSLVGFSYRDRFLPDLEVEREKLYKEDMENKLILQNHIATINQGGK